MIAKTFLRISVVCFLIFFASNGYAQSPVAVKGVLDLRTYSFAAKGPVRLKGEWNFYWKELHTSAPENKDHQWIKLPGVWNGYNWKGEKLSEDGYATFHLKVLLPKEKQLFSIEVPYMYTAYRMYIDSFLICENGKVSHEPTNHVSEFLPKLASFQSSLRGEIDILIQVSNFEDRKGGIWEAPQISTTEKIFSSRSKNLALEFFIIGALVLIGLYQVGLYFIRKEDKSSLYFGIFCLLMGIHSLFVGSVFIQTLFPKLTWSWTVKLEYLSMYTMPVIFFLFIIALFPGYIKNWVIQLFVIFTALASIFILFTSKKTFGFLLDILLVPILAMAFYSFRIILRALKDRKRGSANVLIGIIIFLLFIINEALYGLEYINTGNYMQYGLLIFVVIQSLNIAYIFSQAFKDVKKLTSNLRLTNISYSRFVPAAFLNFLGKPDIISVELGDQKKADMSILFVDIRSFTTLSETMSPQDNFDFINSYFREISPVIRSNEGFVDKFIGDAIMSLFPNKPEDAVNAAIKILLVLKEYNKVRAANYLPLIHVGMGLHTGAVMLGTVGERERMDTTVISDAVNLASRLEALAKFYDIQILTTLSTVEKIQDALKFSYRVIHKGRVKGRNEAVTLVEIFNEDIDPDYQNKMKVKKDYEKAMLLYQQGHLTEALQLFTAVHEILPGDKAAKSYIQRCNKYLKEGLPSNWDGIESLDLRSV
jgi:class 3 adenylate cyclase